MGIKNRFASEEYVTNEINDVLEKLLITPQMYGAVGDGITDDTQAINTAINNIPDGGMLYFPDGTYLVNETDSKVNNERIAINLKNRNNITLLLSDKAILKLNTSNSAYYRVLYLSGCTNITIKGGNIIGDSDNHVPEYNEDQSSIVNTHGYGIRMVESSNITIDGVNISKCYGDPIVICSEATPYHGCQNVEIKNCKLHDSLRNGITVTSCQGLVVKDCEIYNITGALPMAGIDIEGEFEGAVNKDIFIEGCSIHDNGHQSIAASLVCNNVNIKNCNLDLFTMSDDATDVVISDCTIKGLTYAKSNLIIKNCIITGLYVVGAKNLSVMSCIFIPTPDSNSNVNILEAETETCRFIGCEFMSCKTQNKTFKNIRVHKQLEYIHFNSCIFHIERYHETDAIGLGVNDYTKEAEFVNCTFVDTNESYDYQWLNFSCTHKILLSECIFDASKLTNYNTGYSSLIKVGAAETIIVKGCTIKTAKTTPSTYGFHSNMDTVVGDVYYINNVMPMYESINAPTTANRLVVRGNIFSIDEVDASALPSAEEASF